MPKENYYSEDDEDNYNNVLQSDENMFSNKYPNFPTIYDEIMNGLNTTGTFFYKT